MLESFYPVTAIIFMTVLSMVFILFTACFYIFYISLLSVHRLYLTPHSLTNRYKVNKQMLNKKSLVAFLTIAIIGIAAMALGCTSPTPTATPLPNASPTAAPVSGTIKVVGSTSVQPYATDLSDKFTEKYPNAIAQVSGGGSGAGIKAAQDGTAQIGMSSRELTQAEKDSGLKETVIAYDGIAIVVNNANAVSDLTTAQIKDIFAGNITNWKDVGGSDAAITVVTREAGSGTRTAFQEIVMGKVNITTGAVVQSSTGGITQTVAGDRNAIGYISYGSLDNSVKALKVNGVVPSTSTIKDKTYKIQRPFLYVTKGEPTDAVARAFIAFTLSPEGQAILASGKLVTV
ncbi:MAG: PBP superfamily domain protein [Methanocella sp. PtaU1.Bin125]|nr:MAG: PBP superfamily domain protein [Methanocella sp. PtaU1.Bin125]